MPSKPEALSIVWRRLVDLINHATPEQQAEAMTKCTPEAEEWGRRFEDAGK